MNKLPPSAINKSGRGPKFHPIWRFLLFLGLAFIFSCRSEPPPQPTIIVITNPPPPTLADTPLPITTLPVTNTPLSNSNPTLAPTQPPTLTPTPPLALPTYYLTATLDYANHFLQVEETIRLINDSPDNWSELVLNVSPAYWPGIFNLEQPFVTVNGKEEMVSHFWDNTMLHLTLSHPAGSNQPIELTLTYSLNLPQLDPVGWGPKGNAGWGNNVTQVGDWYPALIPYQAGQGWQSWDYQPVGDPVISPLADFNVTINAAPDITLVGPGFTGRDTTNHYYRLPKARAFAFLASHKYLPFSDPASPIPITVYVLTHHENSGPIVLEIIRQAMTLFNQLYGPYPYSEFIMAENGFLTAIEYSAIVSLSGYAFDSYTGNPDSLLVALTAHELAHQWWYGAVGNDQVNEPWLDESLAMMSELLFYEHYYPDLVEWWWQFRVDRWHPTGYVDISIHDYPDSESYVHNMYGQAAHFLAELRQLMGENNFQAFLKAYYQENAFQFATGKAFFALAKNYSDPAGLNNLVRNYFLEMPPNLAP